jgi:alkyl hydroperoxide reductase subunit D
MDQLENLRQRLPETARDIKLNLQSVFQPSALTPAQVWGTAVASAIASRHRALAQAILADAQARQIDANLLEDAKAAAVLMGMNNVYYRFRHMIGKESYAAKPARLRMNWIARPLGRRTDFELFSLAVSAINGCELCVRSHEQVLVEGGVTEDQIHDAVRIAATIQATAIALEATDLAASQVQTAQA